ncbi:Ger(x)C family spore germination protein [Niallia sp.]|uniref:Ger(x)C family spore germination protein n=1 Tax=Niallia sp. TaxID=2837523 RepID=UPI0028A14965|nr:Ger(x)C family spore germination protein [Niallia sp.]
MKQTNLFIIIIFSSLLLTACAGKREINDLALVMGVGIDKGSKDGTIKVTAQVSRPGDARGQTGAPTGQSGETTWNVEGEGESIFEAIRNLTAISSRRVFWAHNFIIVINEEVAKEGIGDIIDFFTRNPELRMRTLIALTPDKASEITATITSLEVIPGEALSKLFRYTNISTLAPHTEIKDLLAAYLSDSTEPILARISLEERKIDSLKPEEGAKLKQVELSGAGVFNNDKLVGILQADELQGVILFRDKIDSGVVVVACPKEPKSEISVELNKQKFDVDPIYKNNEVSFNAKLNATVTVVEAGCPFSVSDKELVEKLEKAVEAKLKEDINKSISKIQKEYKSDVLELGKVFQNEYPYEWKTMKKDWANIFSTAEVNLSIHANVESGSLLFQPTISGKEERKEK